MKGYSYTEENCAKACANGIEASYKDLSQVCGMIRYQNAQDAIAYLELASTGDVPVRFRKFSTNLGHRRELGGQKGRYPEKAACAVLKALNSAVANGKELGLGDEFKIAAISANKVQTLPRLASKGRWARSCLELSKIEIILRPIGAPKKDVMKGEKGKKDEKTEVNASKQPEAKEFKDAKGAPAQLSHTKDPAKAVPPSAPRHTEHKNELGKEQESQKRRTEPPHQHGENTKKTV